MRSIGVLAVSLCLISMAGCAALPTSWVDFEEEEDFVLSVSFKDCGILSVEYTDKSGDGSGGREFTLTSLSKNDEELQTISVLCGRTEPNATSICSVGAPFFDPDKAGGPGCRAGLTIRARWWPKKPLVQEGAAESKISDAGTAAGTGSPIGWAASVGPMSDAQRQVVFDLRSNIQGFEVHARRVNQSFDRSEPSKYVLGKLPISGVATLPAVDLIVEIQIDDWRYKVEPRSVPLGASQTEFTQFIKVTPLRIVLRQEFKEFPNDLKVEVFRVVSAYDVALNSPAFLFPQKVAEAQLQLNELKFRHADQRETDVFRFLGEMHSVFEMAGRNRGVLRGLSVLDAKERLNGIKSAIEY